MHLTTSSGTVTQQMMIDSGSSTASLCDATLASTITATKQDAVSCNLYGTGSSGYNGYFYKGSMSVSGQSMSGPFAVMKYGQAMPCVDGYQGIFETVLKILAVSNTVSGYVPRVVANCSSPSQQVVLAKTGCRGSAGKTI